MKNRLYKSLLLLAIISFSSCETVDLNQTDNPSQLTQEQLDPVYVFNSVQLQLPDFVNSANFFTQRVTRQMAMTNGTSYDNAFAPVDFDNNWTTGYLILNSIKAMEPKAMENQQHFILGASKVIRCYVLMTMVDMYGSIPYSEALQGNANLTPKYDDSESVYAGIYNELNEAIVDLHTSDDNLPGSLVARDLYYGNGNEGAPNAGGWVTLANTLKFKMLVTARLAGSFGGVNIASEISSLDQDIILTPAQDFAFKYGTERDVPNSRHPLYNDQYEFGSGAYIANYFFWTVVNEKVTPRDTPNGIALDPVLDPREKYYFFREATLSTNNSNSQTVPCTLLGRPQQYNDPQYASFYNGGVLTPYCVSSFTYVASNISGATLGTAYLGRDHGDASGIPLDDALRSVVGIYPAGGAIGTVVVVNSSTNAGLKGGLGQGIMPMVLSSYVHFLRAEAMLKLGMSGGNPEDELETAIKQSITKATTLLPAFAPIANDAGIVNSGQPTADQITAQTNDYLAFVRDAFNNASDEDKLQIVIKEYFIASWGNGIEPYNNYRRTGYPSNFQPTVEENPGPFYYTALYPGASVNNNPNAPGNVRTKKVFWDKASLNLH